MTTSFGDDQHSAVLKVPTGEPNGAKHEIPCTFGGMDGKHLKLEAAERISISSAVSVEYSDAMFLGEIVACRRGAADVWELDVKVDQILTGLQSLVALRAQLLGESAPVATRGFVPASSSSTN